MPSLRADIVARRTYQRPNEDGTYEEWNDVVNRCVNHQRWLWERALGGSLTHEMELELAELATIMRNRQAVLAGRTLWMGGTDKAKEREISQFNCSALRVETVHDIVDLFWLLLNGAGVGFKPVAGSLSGFMQPINDIEVIRSERTDGTPGRPHNVETYENGVWTISVGDSGEAWAKSIGKLLAHKYPAKKLVLDFSEVRAKGTRLRGYGWISSGDSVICEQYPAIAQVLSKRAGRLLTKIDILDICNHLGVVQTGRRGAEIALMDYGDAEWEEFCVAKKDYWKHGNDHRSQSNNSLIFRDKPSVKELNHIFDLMVSSGGSEPGIINGKAAYKRAPWFSTSNPCCEILLSNKGLCNLVEVNLAGFNTHNGLLRAIYIMARANYRQTLVNLDDGILQRAWHENNEFLRLCGVGLTGWTLRPDINEHDMKVMRNVANRGAYSMADELGTQIPKNVTCVKPSGTVSKIMDTKEGCHEAIAKYLFNHITFSKHDPLVDQLAAAGYTTFKNGSDGVAVRFPVMWDTGNWVDVDGVQINRESAIAQLERYRSIMRSWCDQNCSITVSYDQDEIPEIINWLDHNWDDYVGVSFLYRTDHTKSAEDLGYPYLPQEPIDEKTYNDYIKGLRPLELDNSGGAVDEILDDECENGVCPVR